MEPSIGKQPFFGMRHVQVLLLFLGYVFGGMIRLNVSIAVVAMTNANTSNPDFPEYDWNGKQKSYIISSIYWGFIIATFFGAMISHRFGTKIAMGVSMMAPSFLSLITPASIPLGGWQIYCGIRFIEGLFQGVFFPSMFEHIAKWAPVEERARLGSISTSGLLIGTISAMIIPGIIARSSLGWPGISYVAGGLGLIWCFFWFIFSDNSPSSSRFISLAEKNYILASQQIESEAGKRKNIPIPWTSILTSVPCLSLMVVGVTYCWTYSTMVAELPLYINGILELDIRNNAFLSGLPFLAMFFMNYVYLFLIEIITKKNIISSLTLRKIVNSISMWIPSLMLLYIGFLDKTQNTMAVVLLVVAVGVSGGQSYATGFNAIDLAPNHAVIIMGLIFAMYSIVAISVPIVTAIIVEDESNKEQWKIVFLIASVLIFLGNLQYLFFGSDQEQHWNGEDYMTKPSKSGKQKNSDKTFNID